MDNFANKRGKEILEHLEISYSPITVQKSDFENPVGGAVLEKVPKYKSNKSF